MESETIVSDEMKVPIDIEELKTEKITDMSLQEDQWYCFENSDNSEIEEYLRFKIAGDSLKGVLFGEYEGIGSYEKEFFGKITMPGKAEVTILTDVEEENEEITGFIWEFDSSKIVVVEGDRGTVGPYEYRSISLKDWDVNSKVKLNMD